MSRTSRHALRVLLALLLAVVAVVGGTTSPASAVQVTYRSGTTGAISFNGPLITGRDTFIPPYSYIGLYETAGFTARRSAAYAGTQSVHAVYTLQANDGRGWVDIVQSDWYSGTVSGTGSIRFPSWATNTPRQATFQQGYRMVINVFWFASATGRQLGWQQMVPSLNGESRCATIYKPCTPFADGIRM